MAIHGSSTRQLQETHKLLRKAIRRDHVGKIKVNMALKERRLKA